MKLRPFRVIACTALLLVCIIGLICNSIWIGSIKDDAAALLREMQESKINIIGDAAEVALPLLARQPKEALAKVLELGWDAWVRWSRGTEIKKRLEIDKANLDVAMRWQSIYGIGAAIAAAGLIVPALPFRRK